MASNQMDKMKTLQEAVDDLGMVEEFSIRMEDGDYNHHRLKIEMNNLKKTRKRLRELIKQENEEKEDKEDKERMRKWNEKLEKEEENEMRKKEEKEDKDDKRKKNDLEKISNLTVVLTAVCVGSCKKTQLSFATKTSTHGVTEVMIHITFRDGTNVNIFWDRSNINPTKLYMFMYDKKSLRKSCHWILDLNHDLSSLTFPLHGNSSGYDLLVCGLKQLSPETPDLPHYQVCGSASEGLKDTSSSNTMTIHLKRNPLEQYFQSEKNGDFEVEKDHKPPSHYILLGLPERDSIHLIRVHQDLPPADFLYVHQGSKGSSFKFPNSFIPASDYHVTVYESEAQKGGSSDRGISCYSTAKVSNALHFRAFMTKNEVNELFVKSCNFVQKQQDSKFVKIAHFYRDKLPAYFDFIFEEKCGIMPTYYKTMSGDKASTVHLKIKGIFFNTLVKGKRNKKPKMSCHGTKRLHIPAPFFFEDVNIYFADFYCHYTAHKVTLIFAVRGTEADKFCKARLKMLDLFKNPFLCIDHDRNVFVRSGVRVEVFYTDEIHVQGLMQELGENNVFLTDVRPLYKPRDVVISKPKREDCNICNLKTRIKAI